MWFKSYLYYTLSKKLMADLPLVKAGFIDFEYIPVGNQKHHLYSLKF
jgi:hypothetical protein